MIKENTSFFTEYKSLYKDSPQPIYIFDEDQNFKKLFFHQYAIDSKNIENSIFITFFNNTLESLSKSNRYQEFNSHNKLLSFYYIFFEILTTNRDYVLQINNSCNKINNGFTFFNDLKIKFLKYASELGLRTLKIEYINSSKTTQTTNKKGIWEEFISVFEFWLGDDSLQFEKTAVYIHEFIHKSQNNKVSFISENLIELNNFIYKYN